MAVAAAAHHPVHDQLRIKRAGLWLFFLSESFIFGLLMAARFFLAGTEREHVDQQLGVAITSVLLTSSLLAYFAETAMEQGRKELAQWCLLGTILLGVIFFGGVGFEWSTAEFSRHEAYGTVFFGMTGMHAFHVLTGVLILCLVWIQLARGRYTAHDHWPVSGGIMYWHFVDLVWVFFYPTLYLLN